VYDSIGFIPADSVGVFVDTNSNPAVKAYSYKISNIDSCGNESMMSDLHKTMHLTINQGTGSSWNLIWNPYVGVPVQTYRIWRADASLTWTKIDSVPGGNTSFTDLTPPTGRLYYQVEIISPYICQPFNYKANTNYNTSRSNTASIPPPPFHASFSASPAFGIAPLTVQFTDLSSGFINDYLWDFGDGNTSTLANPNHTYTQAGLYSVKLKVIGDTEEDSITMVDMIEVDPNGIQTINVGFEMEMYPNPVQGNQQLVIKHPSTLVSKIHVYDILGKAVPFTSATSPQQSELSFDEIAEGIYFVKVSDQNGNYELRKLVVK
jgi:PKD repeat protein